MGLFAARTVVLGYERLKEAKAQPSAFIALRRDKTSDWTPNSFSLRKCLRLDTCPPPPPLQLRRDKSCCRLPCQSFSDGRCRLTREGLGRYFTLFLPVRTSVMDATASANDVKTLTDSSMLLQRQVTRGLCCLRSLLFDPRVVF